MDYDDIFALRNSLALKQKATVAVVTIATYILDGGAPGFPTLSLNILNNAQHAKDDPFGAADKFMWDIAMDGTVQSEGEAATDAHVHAVVNSKYPEVWG